MEDNYHYHSAVPHLHTCQGCNILFQLMLRPLKTLRTSQQCTEKKPYLKSQISREIYNANPHPSGQGRTFNLATMR
jgi:hypothetical protein